MIILITTVIGFVHTLKEGNPQCYVLVPGVLSNAAINFIWMWKPAYQQPFSVMWPFFLYNIHFTAL